jgi:excisionase family DNA binding protein
MQTGTGKPKQKRREPQKPVAVGPLELHRRYTLSEAAAYLRTSLPTIHKHINTGRLETFKEGRRRYATGRGIAALSVPPTVEDGSLPISIDRASLRVALVSPVTQSAAAG